MANRGWLVDRRRLGRMLNHSDPVLRWQFRCLALSWVIGLAAVFGFITTAITLPLSRVAFVPFGVIFVAMMWTKHTRRARRMMGPGHEGPGAASLWAIRNGDYAIRLGYVSILAAFLMIVSEGTAAALGASSGDAAYPFSNLDTAGWIMFNAALLLHVGHMGVARQRNGREPYGMPGSPILWGTIDIILVFGSFVILCLGLATLFLIPPDPNHLLLAQDVLGPVIMTAGLLSWVPRACTRQRDLQDKKARLVDRFPAPQTAAR